MPTNNWQDNRFYKDGHTVRWIRCGPEFFDELNQMIRLAKFSIHFQVYIIDSDETGKKLIDELVNASKRGVEINFVVDDQGSGKLAEKEEEILINAGINFKRFEPFFSANNYYVGRRLHHKVMVVDEKIAMVGGMNVANRYRGTEINPPWIDYAIMIEGPVCIELVERCKVILGRTFKPGKPNWPNVFARKSFLNSSKVWARVRINDWLRNFREVTNSYNKSCRLSKHSINIVGGYFLPGRKFLRILSNASKRGVDVRIILTKLSDSAIVRNASEYLYGKLFRNNIKIFEAQNAMVHGKVAIVDGIWTTVGSYNQNHLSAYISIELNIDIVNAAFAEDFNEQLHHVMQTECLEITPTVYYNRSNFIARIKRWSAYQFVRVSLRMLFAMNRIFGVKD